jgi:hypothetical protein
MKSLLSLAAWAGIACGIIGLGGCGEIHLGASNGSDPIPSGRIVATGTFANLAKTVSGTVTVYEAGSGNYTVRLGTLSAPNEAGLLVVVARDTGTETSFGLKAPTGNQNYSLSSTAGATWAYVTVRNPAAPVGQQDYGRANLVAPSGL